MGKHRKKDEVDHGPQQASDKAHKPGKHEAPEPEQSKWFDPKVD